MPAQSDDRGFGGQRPRLSIKTRTEQSSYGAIAALWSAADGLSAVDGAWVYDHFIPPFGAPSDPCLEGWTTLSALAAQTRRLRVGVMVTGMTFRHPAVLAKMAATVDVISAGRLELGVGAGWHEPEHRAYGIVLPPLRERFDRFDESCAILDAMLTSSPADFHGEHFQLRGAWCEPGPVQDPRPPIVIGGRGENRTLRIAARWADQWNFPGGTAEELAHKIGVLHGHCRAIGRTPAEIEVSVQVDAGRRASAVADQAASFVAAGAEHIVLNLPQPYREDHMEALVEAVADRLEGGFPKRSD